MHGFELLTERATTDQRCMCLGGGSTDARNLLGWNRVVPCEVEEVGPGKMTGRNVQ